MSNTNEQLKIIPSRFTSIDFDENSISNSIMYSSSYFKILGLKCDIDELPESLYFMMNSDTYFRLPMVGADVIEKFNLVENIALIEKILSYFELEEIKPGTSRVKEVNKEIEYVNSRTYEKITLDSNSFISKEAAKIITNLIEKKSISNSDNENILYTYLMRTIRDNSSRISKLEVDDAAVIYSDNSINFIKQANLECGNYEKTKQFFNAKKKGKGAVNSFEKTKKQIKTLIDKTLPKIDLYSTGVLSKENIVVNVKKDYDYKINASLLFKTILCMMPHSMIDDEDYDHHTNAYISLNKEYAELDGFSEVIEQIETNYIKFLSENIFEKNSASNSSLSRVLTSNDENKYIIRELLTPLYTFNTVSSGVNTVYYASEVTTTNDIYDDGYHRDANSMAESTYSTKCQNLIYRIDKTINSAIIDFVTNMNKIIFDGSEPDAMVDIYKLTKEEVERICSRLLSDTASLFSEDELYRFISCPMFLYEHITRDSILKDFDAYIGVTWSPVLQRVTQFSTIDIRNSIKTRYFFTDQHFIDRQNIVIDSCVPKLLYAADLDFENAKYAVKGSSNISALAKRTMYAISPLTAELFNCNQIPIEHLCRVLGYSKQDIKNLMSKVRDLNMNIAFIGAGGTCANTAIWLNEMQKMCNISHLFAKVFCFEEDSLEIHNLLRFPKDPYSHSYDKHLMSYEDDVERMTNKMHYISKELEALSKSSPLLERRFIATGETINDGYYPSSLFSQNQDSIPVHDANGKVIDFKSEITYKVKANTVIYGAPTIETRKNLSNCKGFISATHSDSSCSIWINPEQEADIQVESYGMIQLTSFFMNQLRMAIGLLEILSAENKDELLYSEDNNFMNYSFNQENSLSTDRVYNFKVEANAGMVNDEEADLAF